MDLFNIITTSIQCISLLALLVLYRLRAILNLKKEIGELTTDYAIKSFLEGNYGEASVAFEYFYDSLPSNNRMLFSFKKPTIKNWMEPAKLELLMEAQKAFIKLT